MRPFVVCTPCTGFFLLSASPPHRACPIYAPPFAICGPRIHILLKYVYLWPCIGALRLYVYCHVLEDKLYGTMFQLDLIPSDLIFQ
jgi:hypothetical protein